MVDANISLSCITEDEVAYSEEGDRTFTEVKGATYSDISNDEEDRVVTELREGGKEDNNPSGKCHLFLVRLIR